MKSDTIIEVVSALIGEVDAVGESNADEVRLKNLKNIIDLSDWTLRQIYEASRSKDRVEGSMKLIGQEAYNYLQSIRDWSED